MAYGNFDNLEPQEMIEVLLVLSAMTKPKKKTFWQSIFSQRTT